MKSLNKTETPIFLSAVCSLFPKAILFTFISIRVHFLGALQLCRYSKRLPLQHFIKGHEIYINLYKYHLYPIVCSDKESTFSLVN